VAIIQTGSVSANRVSAPSRTIAGVTGTTRLRPARRDSADTCSTSCRESSSVSLAPAYRDAGQVDTA
jgi:hypothetical protein